MKRVSTTRAQKVRGCLFLCFVLLLVIPHTTQAQLLTPNGTYDTPIETARKVWEEWETPLTLVDYHKEVRVDTLLDNYLALTDVWSYLFQYREEGAKILKDSWMAFKKDADFNTWKDYWPKSASLLVAWKANNTWAFSAVYAEFVLTEATGDVVIQWHFNEWKNVHYNIYVIRDYFLQKFVPAAARAPQGEIEYEQLMSVLRTGAKDGQYEIRVKMWSGNLTLPAALILVLLGYGYKRRK